MPGLAEFGRDGGRSVAEPADGAAPPGPAAADPIPQPPDGFATDPQVGACGGLDLERPLDVERQKEAILEAIASSSLARIRHALRLMEELGPTKRGPAFRVELLGTYSLEPLRPVLQLALNCFPAQAELRIGPLDSIETQISQPVRVAKEELLHARVVLWRAEECFLKSFILFPMGFPKVLHLAAINYLGGLKVS